jgi:GTPase SAR1 family protein
MQSVRVLVVGDEGVGKTSFVSFLASREPVTRAPEPTVGCNLEVLVRRCGVLDSPRVVGTNGVAALSRVGGRCTTTCGAAARATCSLKSSTSAATASTTPVAASFTTMFAVRGVRHQRGLLCSALPCAGCLHCR